MLSLLTLDLPSEVQTWHSWSQRHTGTMASSPTSQRDQNRRGYKIRHHTRLPPQHTIYPRIYIHADATKPMHAHTHTHERQSHAYCKGINSLNLICSKHSPPFSFLPSAPYLLMLHRWGDTERWSPEEAQGHTWGLERGLLRRRSVRVLFSSSANSLIVLSI